jgi:transcriptional regulator PpsR
MSGFAAQVVALKDMTQARAGAMPARPDIDPLAARAALMGFADVTLVVDSRGDIQSVAIPEGRPAVEEIGLAEGQAFRETLTRDSLGKAQELLDNALPDKPGRARELNHRTPSGSVVAIRYQALRLGEDGDILLVGQDLSVISEFQQRLVQAQQATERDYSRIRAMETRYRVLFQLSNEPMLICDAATRKVTEANAACLAAFKMPLSRLVGRSLPSLFDEHDGEALGGLITNAMSGAESRAAVLRAAAGEARFNTTVNLFRQDGASHLLVRPTPATGAGHQAAANDATFLHALLERLPEAFVVTDGDGRVIEANRRFLDVAELPALSAASGHVLDDWLGRPGIDFGVLMASLKDSGAIRGFSTVLRGAYGAQEPVDVTAAALFDHAEPRFGFLMRTEPLASVADPAAASNIPRSVEQMKQLVGSVPMKDLVRETTDMIERLCIEAALELTGDNRASAADMLGLSRQSLYAKLHRFGMGDLLGEPQASS